MDPKALRRMRNQRFFQNWDGFVSARRVGTAEASLKRLVDDLIALGPNPTEDEARRAVDECVQRFNAVDDGWIMTTEREDICEQIGQVVDQCGFDCDEDWFEERDW